MCIFRGEKGADRSQRPESYALKRTKVHLTSEFRISSILRTCTSTVQCSYGVLRSATHVLKNCGARCSPCVEGAPHGQLPTHENLPEGHTASCMAFLISLTLLVLATWARGAGNCHANGIVDLAGGR